jgi:alanyl-tRNA synthetase
MEEARAGGALMFFGDKYGERVRVVTIPEEGAERPFSAELCGGTHVHETGEVGFFTVLSDSSIGAGVRRIEALTGLGAERWIAEQIGVLDRATRRLNTTAAELEAKVVQLQGELDAERKRRLAEERRAGQQSAGDLLGRAEQVDGVSMVVARVEAASADALRQMGDTLRGQLGSGVIVLGAVVGERPSFLAMVTPDLTGRLQAGKLIGPVAKAADGGGGGRPEMAQAGGKDAAKLDAALDLARRLVKESLSAAG